MYAATLQQPLHQCHIILTPMSLCTSHDSCTNHINPCTNVMCTSHNPCTNVMCASHNPCTNVINSCINGIVHVTVHMSHPFYARVMHTMTLVQGLCDAHNDIGARS